MRAVNLLPRDLAQTRKAPSKPAIVGCVGAVVATVALAGGYLNASSSVGKQKTALEAAQAQLAAIPPPVPPPAVVTALPQERQQRVAALASVLANRVAWDRVLREISLVLPDDVWLSALSGTTPGAGATAAPTPTGQGLHLTGFTYSQASVARLLARLTVVPELEGVTLNSANQSDPTVTRMRSVVQFDISANLRASASTAPSTS